jgi:putative sigma-54 modulation protein
MQIKITRLHFEKSQKLNDYAIKKVEGLQKFHPKIELIQIRLIGKEANRGQEKDYFCELEIDLPGNNLVITDVERSMDKAIDRAIDRAKKLLRRTKEKALSKKHKEGIRAKKGL